MIQPMKTSALLSLLLFLPPAALAVRVAAFMSPVLPRSVRRGICYNVHLNMNLS